MAKTEEQSKKPTNLKIERKGRTFTASWGCGAKNYDDGQKLKWTISGTVPTGSVDVVEELDLGKDTREKSKTAPNTVPVIHHVGHTSYTTNEPFTPTKAHVAVKGNRSNTSKTTYTWSDWAKADFDIYAPQTPTVTPTYSSEVSGSYTYEEDMANNSQYHCSKVQWQTILVENTPYGATPPEYAWSGASVVESTSASYTWPNTETFSTAREDYSYTRYFRARGYGWKGYGAWGVCYNRFAKARKAVITSSSFDGRNVYMWWSVANTFDRPIDKIEACYLVEDPVITVTNNISDPNNTSVGMSVSPPSSSTGWAVGQTPNVDGNPSTSFSRDSALPNNKCIFTRVNTYWQNIPTYGDAVVTGYSGLDAPSIQGDIVPGDGTWTVNVNRGNAPSGAAIAVYMRTTDAPNLCKIVGVIPPPGVDGYSRTSITLAIPQQPAGVGVSFGVKAFIGNYSPHPSRVTSNVYTEHFIDPSSTVMESSINWNGGQVPLPPTAKASVVENTNDTIQVQWDWPWSEANQAELSWADHEDAWMSTSEPQTYVVTNSHASIWNIPGLAIGEWWIRVRLMKALDDSVAYGTYAILPSVKLSAAPATPSMIANPSTIAEDGETTCTWAYVTGDGTPQSFAEIYEMFYQYSAVTNPSSSANPYSNVWYELVNGKYIRSTDDEVESGKTYYQVTGDPTPGAVAIATTNTAQHLVLRPSELVTPWKSGETHYISLVVKSASGELSQGFSAPIPISIAEPIVAKFVTHELVKQSISYPVDQGDTPSPRTVLCLTKLPTSFYASGAGIGGETTYIIERVKDLDTVYPDESPIKRGFKGEIVCIKTTTNNLPCIISQEDLNVSFNDDCEYKITAIMKDKFGQGAQTSTLYTGDYVEVEYPVGSPIERGYYILSGSSYVLSDDEEVDPNETYYIPESFDTFEVHWDHQAEQPEATVTIDRDEIVSFITPNVPAGGYDPADVVDIYRLSVDSPTLIIEGGSFGTYQNPVTYVDPYPTLGQFGGYRVVYRTYNGDYTTETKAPAWTDYTAIEDESIKHNVFGIIINFGGEQLILPYNIKLSDSWSKDFTKTEYLGGSIHGDWNPGVSRTSSLTTSIPVEVEPDKISALRRLADYPGICHVRTPDGSSYAANVNVKDDRESKWVSQLSNVTLEVTKVDSETVDGMTYAEWISTNS